MPKEVIVTTTKPPQSLIEYGIRDTVTGAWLRHGEVVTVSVGSLSSAEQLAVQGSRTILAAPASAESDARGRSPAVTVVTTHPPTDSCHYVLNGRESEPPFRVALRIADLSPADQATLQAAKTLFTGIATADATTKGFLP